MIKYDVLYKRGSDSSSIYAWWQEQDEDKYRSCSGKLDGKIVESKWTVAKSKNVGKANATTGVEQAAAEIEAKYVKQKKLGYSEDIDKIDEFFFVQPMLAKSYDDYKSKLTIGRDEIWSSPKLDGIRCIITKDGAFSRKGEPFHTIPHVLLALQHTFEDQPELVIDGELYNHAYKDDFNTIQSLIMRKKPTQEDLDESEKLVQYHIYDVMLPSVPALQFSTRNNMVELVVQNERYDTFCLVHCNSEKITSTEQMDELYGKYLLDGYEGQMLRVGTQGYENKRTKNLLKRKEFMDDEFTLLEISPGKGNRSEVAGYVTFQNKTTKVISGGGIRGSFGFAEELLKNADKYIGGDVTIRFQNYTPDGIPRFPVAIKFYEGQRNS